MSPKLLYIKTFGCQMNEHDSSMIRGLLACEGYEATDDIAKADVILFNTCTVREKPHHKAMSEIGRARLFKEKREGVIVGVCGCVAQEEKGNIFQLHPHVDIVFGPDQIHMLPKLLKSAKERGQVLAADLINDPDAYHFLGSDLRVTSHPSTALRAGESRVTAFVSIMKGCNCACSYCIVPKVRGREVCRPAGDIIKEVRALVKSGTREVVLLGQNVNSYGKGGKTSFTQLIKRLSDETDIQRIRFTSPHPRDVGDDLIKEYTENEKLMPHIHLPLQSGSDAVLKKMRRGYTRARYIGIAKKLRSARNGMGITADIIAGFPSETRADHEDTIALMKEVEFDSIFAFKYSPRPGTEACEKFADDVEPEEKARRLDEILKLQRMITRKRNEALIGKESEALVTGADETRSGALTGRFPDNRLIHFAGNLSLIGDIVRIRVTGANNNSLKGEIEK